MRPAGTARGEHPFGDQRVAVGRELVIEPMTYLRAHLEDFRSAGGTLHIRRFDTLQDVASLSERTVLAHASYSGNALPALTWCAPGVSRMST